MTIQTLEKAKIKGQFPCLNLDIFCYVYQVVSKMLTPARTIEAYLQMGISLSLQDKHHHAKKYYEKVLVLDPRNITALINLANCYNLAERYEDCLNLYVQAKTVSSKDIELWIGLASLYLHTGNLENAIYCCNIASILNPNLFTVWHIRGIILRKKGYFHRAIFCYARCLELKPVV